MELMSKEVKEGLMQGKRYERGINKRTLSIENNYLCVNSSQDKYLTVNDLNGDWQEVEKYPLTFLEALDEMRKGNWIQCVCNEEKGYYWVDEDELFFKKDETTPYAIKSGESFNSLLKRKWKVCK